MPAIASGERKNLLPSIEAASNALGYRPSVGMLNYFITTVLDRVCLSTYTDFNEVIGVLECIKQEFYRRVIAPYEDKKYEANGEVYKQR